MLDKSSLIILVCGMVVGGGLIHLIKEPAKVAPPSIISESGVGSEDYKSVHEVEVKVEQSLLQSDSELQKKIANLEAELRSLKAKTENETVSNDSNSHGSDPIIEITESEYRSLQDEVRKLEGHNQLLERQVRSQEPSEISDDQMKALVEAPFDEFLTMFKGQNRDEVYDFFNQEPDPNWGFQIEQNISDFVATHHKAPYISLAGISCKVDTCEVRLVETDYQNNHMHVLLKEMQRQTWWNFKFNQTSSSSDHKNDVSNLFMYLKT